MYDFIIKNRTAIPAVGRVVIPADDEETRVVKFIDDTSRDRITARLPAGEFTVETFDAPPEALLTALEGREFNGSRDLEAFLALWERGEAPETISTLARRLRAAQVLTAINSGVEVDMPIEEQAALTEEAVRGIPVVEAGDGDAWRAGVYVAAGQTVSHGGKLWKCVQGHTTQAAWAPGFPGLDALWTEAQPVGVVAEWKQPAGAHDAYKKGEYMAWTDGAVYRCLSDNTVHAPAELPGAWEIYGTGGNEPPGNNTPPAWVQPAGAHDAYKKGDRVAYNNAVWVSTLDGNVWMPGVYGWTPES